MWQEEEIMAVLGEPNVINLILFLDGRAKTIGQDLDQVSKGRTKLRDTAGKLQDVGILEIRTVFRPNKTILYTLTEKGKRMAELFRQAKAVAMEH